MNRKNAVTELLEKSEKPFYEACKAVKVLEKDFERILGYLNYLGIDPMDGTPTAEEIVAMRIQELKRTNGNLIGRLNAAEKELFNLKENLKNLSVHGKSYGI